MANVNKVTLIGRLTRDPDVRSFATGGKITSFGFAVNNRKKNSQGEWEDDPCFLDVKCFDRERGLKLASLVESYVKKGHPLCVLGHLVLEQWEDKKAGGRRSKVVVVADDIQLLEPKSAGNAAIERPVFAGSVPRDDHYDDSPF